MRSTHPTDIVCPVARWSRAAPDQPALITRTASWSYRDVDAWTRNVRRNLETSGVSSGDVVAVQSTVRPAVLPLLWATWRIGAVLVPLSTREPAATLADRLRFVGASCLVSEDPRPQMNLSGSDGGKRIAKVSLDALGPSSPKTVHPSASTPESCRLDLSARASVIFTSGSTGTPKAAVHRLRNHYYSALGSAENISLQPGDRWLASLPWYHVGGLAIFFRCALSGAAVAVPEQGEGLARGVEELAPTHLSLVSTQLQRLLSPTSAGSDPASPRPRNTEHRGKPGASVINVLRASRAILLGGGAMPEGLIDRAVNLGCPIHTSYGCTEMASQVTTTPPGASREMLTTSGRVLAYRTVVIGDGPEENQRGPVKENESAAPVKAEAHDEPPAVDETREDETREKELREGEIRVGGLPLFAGYVDPRRGGEASGATGPLDDPRDEDGLYPTGDLGYLDEEGRLHVTGRLDHLIVSGGENIQPEEIERHLNTLPGVRMAVVVGVPDPEFGERPVAFVDWAGEVRTDLDAELRRSLPGYKVPDAFYDMPADPTSGAMKVDRRALEAAARMLQKR